MLGLGGRRPDHCLLVPDAFPQEAAANLVIMVPPQLKTSDSPDILQEKGWFRA